MCNKYTYHGKSLPFQRSKHSVNCILYKWRREKLDCATCDDTCILWNYNYIPWSMKYRLYSIIGYAYFYQKITDIFIANLTLTCIQKNQRAMSWYQVLYNNIIFFRNTFFFKLLIHLNVVIKYVVSLTNSGSKLSKCMLY